MNTPSPSHALTKLISNLAHDGLGYFVTVAGIKPTPALLALQARPSLKALREAPRIQWQQLAERVHHALTDSDGALHRLNTALKLDFPELVLLCIIGELEISTTLSQAMDELLGTPAGRPTVRLAVDILRFLRADPDWSAEQLQQSPLMQRQILHTQGHGPWPTQTLQINPLLWNQLKGQTTPPPGCQPLPTQALSGLSRQTIEQLPRWTQHLHAQPRPRLHIRSPSGSTPFALAQLLSDALHLEPLLVNAATSLDDTLIEWAKWLPIIDLRTTSARPHTWPQTCCVITSLEDTLSDYNGLTIDLPPLSQEERHALWREHLPNRNIAKRLGDIARLEAGYIIDIAQRANALAGQENVSVQSTHLITARTQHALSELDTHITAEHLPAQDNQFIASDNIRALAEQWLQRCKIRGLSWRGLDSQLAHNAPPGLRLACVGAHGTGKTHFARWFATQADTPLLRLELEESHVFKKTLRKISDLDAIALLDCKTAADIERLQSLRNLLNQHPGIVIIELDNPWTALLHGIRLDGVHHVPTLDTAQRQKLWKQFLGSRAPRGDFLKALAEHTELPPGAIGNAVLCAAAATDRKRVRRADLLLALRAEYQTLGYAFPEALTALERELPPEPINNAEEDNDLETLADTRHTLPPSFVQHHPSSDRDVQTLNRPEHRNGDEEITVLAR